MPGFRLPASHSPTAERLTPIASAMSFWRAPDASLARLASPDASDSRVRLAAARSAGRTELRLATDSGAVLPACYKGATTVPQGLGGHRIIPVTLSTMTAELAPRASALAAAQPDSWPVIAGWLLEQTSLNTRTAYSRDIALLSAFLGDRGVPLTMATRQQVAMWAEQMRRTVKDDGSRAVSEGTIGRRLSSASSFFAYAAETGAMTANPIRDMKRPKRHADEDTIAWLDRDQMLRFLTAAQAHSSRAHAVSALMLTTAARTSEILAADVPDLGWTGGHRVLRVVRKGNKRQNLPVAPWVGVVTDAYLDGRETGPLIATWPRDGGIGRMDEPALHRLVRTVAARAKLPNAGQLHPHSLRHSALTEALERDCSLRDVQALAGHVDPRTTERYDRMRSRLGNSPAYKIAASLAPDE